MANISYNQSGFTYNEQYSSYQGFKSIEDNCTAYNEVGLSYNEVGYPYLGICNITILAESVDMTLSLPDSDVVYAVSFQANVLNLLLTQPIADISTTSNVSLSPNALSLVISLPSSQVSIPKLIEANPLTVTLSNPSPTIEAIRNVYLSPDVIELLSSIPSAGIEAIENLNISVIPKMKVHVNATNSQIYNQGFTYNESGSTYNDADLSYGGVYGEQYKVITPQIVKNIRPTFS